MLALSARLLNIVVVTLLTMTPLHAKAGTIIQSATGLNCSSNCINGVCTNTCTDGGAMYKGNGDIGKQKLLLEGFNSIRVDNVELHVVSSKDYSVIVETDTNLFDQVVVVQNDDELDISLKQGSYENANFKVIVSLPHIDALELQSVSNGLIAGFEQEEFELSMAGVANLSGENNYFQVLKYRGTGVTTLDFSKSKVENAGLDVDGASNVSLSFTAKHAVLAGIVQGVSSVKYCGDPDNQLKVYGVTDIQRIEC